MCESCVKCKYLNKDKLIYNSIKKERFKYGCSIRRYTTDWLQNDEQLIKSKCGDYFFVRNATESCQNAENETECNNLINCKDEEKDTLKIENTKPDDRKPIPKDGQLDGQIDLFNMELWEV